MAVTNLDLKGLKCPQPAMKIATILVKLKPGDIIEAEADCPTFEQDVRNLCTRWKKVVLAVKMKAPSTKVIQIQI